MLKLFKNYIYLSRYLKKKFKLPLKTIRVNYRIANLRVKYQDDINYKIKNIILYCYVDLHDKSKDDKDVKNITYLKKLVYNLQYNKVFNCKHLLLLITQYKDIQDKFNVNLLEDDVKNKQFKILKKVLNKSFKLCKQLHKEDDCYLSVNNKYVDRGEYFIK